MYPDFRYLFHSLFGVDAPEWLSLFKTFGFLVAIAFMAAIWVITRELKRKEEEGLLVPEFSDEEIGQPATPNELLWSALVGFLLGYKIGGIFGGHWVEVSPNPLGYIFSIKGNLLVGIAGALIMAYAKYAEKKKQQLPQPKTRRISIYPHQRVSEIIVIGALGGLVGAKLFNAFETWDDFLAHPAENLLSSSGLTFYGGLIVATIIFYFFARKHKIPFAHLCDAAAPALMLSYGIGRFGCQFSGDGDWGIHNSAYITAPDGSLNAAPPDAYNNVLQANAAHYIREYGSLDKVPHLNASAHGLPRWLVAQNYPHNVGHEGVLLPGCTGDYCTVLPVGVFPTPLYEAFACIGLFFVLWALRKRIRKPFHIFGVYLILNGIERFFVEQIRVNYKYDWGFLHPTQAEIIAVLLMLSGLSLVLFYKDKATPAEI